MAQQVNTIAAEPETGAQAANPWEGRKSEWNAQGHSLTSATPYTNNKFKNIRRNKNTLEMKRARNSPLGLCSHASTLSIMSTPNSTESA